MGNFLPTNLNDAHTINSLDDIEFACIQSNIIQNTHEDVNVVHKLLRKRKGREKERKTLNLKENIVEQWHGSCLRELAMLMLIHDAASIIEYFIQWRHSCRVDGDGF